MRIVADTNTVIVTGDNDLLTLKCFEQIPIVTAAEALRITGKP